MTLTTKCLKIFLKLQNPRSIMDNNSPATALPEFQPVNLFSTEDFFKEDSIVKPAKST